MHGIPSPTPGHRLSVRLHGGSLYRLDFAGVPRPPLPTWLPQPAPSPFEASIWQEALQNYPDKRLCSFIVQALQEGFRVGYHAPQAQLQSAQRNIPSAYDRPEVVNAYLANECQLGQVLGPMASPPGSLHISRFGVIPKKSQPGKW